MKKSAWYVILLLVVLVAAITVSVSSLFAESGEGGETLGNETPFQPSASPSAEVDVQISTQPSGEISPSPTQNVVIETKAPVTQAPTVTQSPVNTPSPTVNVPTVSASGSFSSDTETYLNLQVDWSAYNTDSGAVMLKVEVSAVSYSFYTSALYNSIEVTVNGTTYYANSPEVAYDGSELKITPMASFTVPVDTGNTDISVVWHYKGSYSGVELGDIKAEGTAWIG